MFWRVGWLNPCIVFGSLMSFLLSLLVSWGIGFRVFRN
jgi:hypothetical protein